MFNKSILLSTCLIAFSTQAIAANKTHVTDVQGTGNSMLSVGYTSANYSMTESVSAGG